MFRYVKFTVLAVCAVLLTACVSNIEKPSMKVDKEKALESNVKLGMTYLSQGNRDGAMRSFTRALDLDKNSAEAHQGMALVHQMNGEPEHAEKRFKKALKSRVDFSRSGIEVSYGRFLYEQGRYSEALKYFDKAASDFTYSGRATALYYTGMAAKQTGDKVRAKAAFEHALNLNRRFANAAYELAAMSFEERDYAQSKRYLDLFAKNARHTAQSLWLGIRIERIFGNKDKESSYALALKNLHPYSKEYLDYKNTIELQE